MFLLALGLTVVTGIPTIPRVFDWVLGKLRKIRQPKPGQVLETVIEDFEPEQPAKPGRFHLRPQTLVLGWIGDMIAWALMGWSLWATIRALGVELDLLTHWPLLTACTALALVAGFVSLIPGGAGVRELVFILLLKPLVQGDALLTVAIPGCCVSSGCWPSWPWRACSTSSAAQRILSKATIPTDARVPLVDRPCHMLRDKVKNRGHSDGDTHSK